MTEPKIIYEDENVLVVDKPSGLLVHGEGSDTSGTLVEWFLGHVPAAHGVGEPRLGKDGKEIERSGIVHRLDKDTSGVMVLAKTQSAFLVLKEQFQERLVKKEYRAIVYGVPKERWGTIDKPIGRSSTDWRRRSAERGARGFKREAVTDWERLKFGEYSGEKFSYLKLKPKTGRMHQLRVHLKSIGYPIVGDVLYAETKIKASNNLNLDRLALHAFSLTILLPKNELKTFEVPVPATLEKAVEIII